MTPSPTARILWVDPFAGVAGDMLLGALFDLGASPERVREGLDALGIDGWTWTLSRPMRGVIAGTHVAVVPAPLSASPLKLAAGPSSVAMGHHHDHGHSHDHGHGHDHGHSHDHGQEHHEPHFPDQPERSWRTIRALISSADLPARAKERALSAFSRLAGAEARVHGMSIDAVVFHEVGSVDAIVDIVGVCLALEDLDVDRIVCGPLPVSRGWTHSAHGRIPLPAPATLFLMEGWPICPGRPDFEQVTPTGAALITALAEPGEPPEMTVVAVGHGAGTKDLPDLPNLVRATLGTAPAPSPVHVSVLTAQMDDLAGEQVPALIEKLLQSGALDATLTPVHMKKGRPGWQVQALCRPADAEAVATALLRHGSTFGVRRHEARRTVLDRRFETVATPWGDVQVKIGLHHGEVVQVSPEHADVSRVALAGGVSERRVHSAALAAHAQTTVAGGSTDGNAAPSA